MFSQAVLTVEGLIQTCETVEANEAFCSVFKVPGGTGFKNKVSEPKSSLGDLSGGDTPCSIPNQAVKPASADGT